MRRARIALAVGRALESLALAAGIGLLGGALGEGFLATAAPALPAALALLLWRARRTVPSATETARTLDRRHGTGEAASSALAARMLPGVAALCVRSAQARLGGEGVAVLALPSARPLAAAGLAACAAFAALAIGPARRATVAGREVLAAIDAFAAALDAEGRPGGAALAAGAEDARRVLAEKGGGGEREKRSIERLARETLALAGETPPEGRAARAADGARAAAGALLALAHERGAPDGGAAGTGARGETSRAGGGGPERGSAGTSFLAVRVPPQYEEIVARYFARER
ncbi:MAG TPA: hypothetical protein VFI25_00440 [Planctomycetota bacterium]|nr:hypothetical protein [Planctomycetota bacterium]